MYNDEIKVANKIITDKVLTEIFQKMDEELRELIKLNQREKTENEKYSYEYQHWTVKNFNGSFKCTFNFYDDTNITIDNYNNFTTIFNNRLQEVKSMWVRYYINYSIVDGRDYKTVSQHINMNIYENKMSIDVSLSSEDNKMNSIYSFIKEKILTAPPKYTKTIKNKNIIKNRSILAFGIIPSIVICTILFFIPSIRETNNQIYLLYPFSVIIVGYLIGNITVGAQLEDLYDNIIPDKKYAGYDSNKKKSIYKDDMDKYLDTSEIIIGKNINNIKCRKEIKKIDNKYKKYLPIEIAVLIGLSILIPIIGKML